MEIRAGENPDCDLRLRSQGFRLHINPGKGDPAHCQPGPPTQRPAGTSSAFAVPHPPTPPLCLAPLCHPHHPFELPSSSRLAHWARGQSLEIGNLSSGRGSPESGVREEPSPLHHTLRKDLLWTLPRLGLGAPSPVSGQRAGVGPEAPRPSSCRSPPHSPASSMVRWQRAARRSSHERGGGAMVQGGWRSARGSRQGRGWCLS